MPRLGTLNGMPRPKNDRPVSMPINDASVIVKLLMIIDTMLGSTSLKRIMMLGVPMVFDAFT
jgi:hypothetical protein